VPIHGWTRASRGPHVVRHKLHCVGALMHHAWVKHLSPSDTRVIVHGGIAMYAWCWRINDAACLHACGYKLHARGNLAWAHGHTWDPKGRPAIGRKGHQRPLLRGSMTACTQKDSHTLLKIRCLSSRRCRYRTHIFHRIECTVGQLSRLCSFTDMPSMWVKDCIPGGIMGMKCCPCGTNCCCTH